MALRRTILPHPPNPDDTVFAGAPMLFNRAVYDWMQQVKGRLEIDSQSNNVPAAQPFLATNFTTNTVVTGTTTGTDLANAVASLVQAFTDNGRLSPRRAGG